MPLADVSKASIYCPICYKKHIPHRIYIQSGARLQEIKETSLVFCEEKNEYFLFTQNAYVSFSNDSKNLTNNTKQLNPYI